MPKYTHTLPNRRGLSLVGGGGFFLLGVVASVLGPLLPALRDRFDVSAAATSVLLALYAGGSVMGVLLAGRPSLSAGRVLQVASAAVGGGAVTIAASPSWWLALTGATLLGVGFGALDLGLNVVVSRGYGEHGAVALTALSATFGAGAVLGPIVVSLSPAAIWPALLDVTGLALVLLVLMMFVGLPPGDATTARTVRSERRDPSPLFRFGLVLFCYVAAESGTAGWETTHLRETAGYSDTQAARATALFWGALTVGRLIAAPFARWRTVKYLILGSLTLACTGLTLAVYPPTALAGYTLTGLALAPVFPATFAWLTREAGHGYGTVGAFASALLGPFVATPLIGLVISAGGVRTVPVALAVIVLLDLGAVLLVKNDGRRVGRALVGD